MNETIAEIRKSLCLEPSEVAWKELVNQLKDWGGTTTEQASVLEYVKQHLAQWPDGLLVAPEQWLDQLSEGHRLVTFLPI